MKKLFAVLTALLPVIYGGSLQVSASLGAEDEVLFLILGSFLLIGFLFPVIFSVLTRSADRKLLAVSNLWFYGGNLLVFACEIVLWLVRYREVRIAEQNGGMEGGLGLALLIVLYIPHWISYLAVRIVGAVGTARALKGACREDTKVVHIFLQLFPVADLLSAIWVLGKVKVYQNSQQPPIEMK